MSVINKMLRDLDARRAQGSLPDLSRDPHSGAVQGAVAVGSRGRRISSRRTWALLAALVLIALGAYSYEPLEAWVMQPAPVATAHAALPAPVAPAPEAPQTAASAPVASLASMAASAPVSAPTSASPASQAKPLSAPTSGAMGHPAPVALNSKAAAPSPTAPLAPVAPVRAGAAPLAAASAATVPAKAAGAGPVAASSAPTVLPRATAMAPAVSPTPTPPASSAATTAVAPRTANAVQETLAQAQALWAAGSREAAAALVRDAVAAAERAPASDAELQQAVRELARMELALGRSAALLELLTRLEPRLAEQADLWAVRGNAAQRLGLHAQAVQAYTQALRLRGSEQRWMLGAAVSLAAMGQMDAAARQVEQARALGPVNSEVLGYLRQAGVPLR